MLDETNLHTNIDKTTFIMFFNRNKVSVISNLHTRVISQNILKSDIFNLLGIMLDQLLSWKSIQF